MFKKILFLIVTIFGIYLISTVSMAAPLEIDPSYAGTAKIVDITNPSDGVTTFKDHVVVSITGDEGAIVTLYVYNPETKKFDLYTQANGENSWFVGPSGLFVKRLPISNGVNYIGVFAELNGYDQFLIRRVDKTDPTIQDEIKSILIQNVDDMIKNTTN